MLLLLFFSDIDIKILDERFKQKYIKKLTDAITDVAARTSLPDNGSACCYDLESNRYSDYN